LEITKREVTRMNLMPAFEIGVWNAWIFFVPWLFLYFGLTSILKSFRKDRKSTFWKFPSYTGLERMYLLLWFVVYLGLFIYSIFLPLAIGTAWFYVGFPVFIIGIVVVLLAIRAFTVTPVDKPNTIGVYRISRHPWYVGATLIFIGISIASASWLYLLLTLIWLLPTRNVLMIPEERECCERFGDVYREYMKETSRWIGLPKSGSNKQP
jgi:protein-S-isoprenylcysteine O-methyltransferase Ste14